MAKQEKKMQGLYWEYWPYMWLLDGGIEANIRFRKILQEQELAADKQRQEWREQQITQIEKLWKAWWKKGYKYEDEAAKAAYGEDPYLPVLGGSYNG